ncbi:MAG: MoaD/ThiS family protein [Candidatus Omnitrophica bacterium]|nr:MoaD/ThiS family protein [Candidatus Omnitrophota bacterium]
MSIKVRIPTPLQSATEQKPEVEVEGATIGELLANLEGEFPNLRQRLRDDSGKLRRFINIYLNDEDIRFLENEATPVKETDEVSIIPAIAGGTVD